MTVRALVVRVRVIIPIIMYEIPDNSSSTRMCTYEHDYRYTQMHTVHVTE